MIWLLITLIGFLSAYLFAWYTIPLIAIIVCYAMGTSWFGAILQSFFAGIGVNVALIALTTYSVGLVMYDPLAQVMMLPSGWVMALITAVIGGILSGLGGAAGYALRTISMKRRM